MSEREHEPVSDQDERERALEADRDREADDAVTEASEGSFPASDAPPWTSSATPGGQDTTGSDGAS